MPKTKFLAVAMAAALTVVAPTAEAAFVTQGEFRSALGGANSQLADMPAHSITITDNVGSYTPATIGMPVPISLTTGGEPDRLSNGRVFIRPAPTEAGQLAGNFGCVSFAWPCLGAHTVTYTLPFEIIGLSGMLNLSAPNGQLSDIGFFEFPRNYVAPDGNPFRYNGFWGDTFAPTNTLTIVWSPGVFNTDNVGSFTLSNAQVVRATPVSEPASMALFVAGLLGLLGVRRKLAA
jgi:hypothetical protein